MTHYMLDNPYFAQPGVSPDGDTCILIVDENYVDIARRMYNQARFMPYAHE